jgi:hypothetical protein
MDIRPQTLVDLVTAGWKKALLGKGCFGEIVRFLQREIGRIPAPLVGEAGACSPVGIGVVGVNKRLETLESVHAWVILRERQRFRIQNVGPTLLAAAN